MLKKIKQQLVIRILKKIRKHCMHKRRKNIWKKKVKEYWKLKIISKFKEVENKIIENSPKVKQRNKKLENIRKKIDIDAEVRKSYIKLRWIPERQIRGNCRQEIAKETIWEYFLQWKDNESPD